MAITFNLDSEIPTDFNEQNDRKATYPMALYIIDRVTIADNSTLSNSTSDNTALEASDELLNSIQKFLVNSTKDSDSSNEKD